ARLGRKPAQAGGVGSREGAPQWQVELAQLASPLGVAHDEEAPGLAVPPPRGPGRRREGLAPGILGDPGGVWSANRPGGAQRLEEIHVRHRLLLTAWSGRWEDP